MCCVKPILILCAWLYGSLYNLPYLDPPLNSGSNTMETDCTNSTEYCEQLVSLKL